MNVLISFRYNGKYEYLLMDIGIEVYEFGSISEKNISDDGLRYIKGNYSIATMQRAYMEYFLSNHKILR